jgi:hypothetical protein
VPDQADLVGMTERQQQLVLLSKHHGVHPAGWMITAITLGAGALLVRMAHTRPATTPAVNSSPPLEPVTAPA